MSNVRRHNNQVDTRGHSKVDYGEDDKSSIQVTSREKGGPRYAKQEFNDAGTRQGFRWKGNVLHHHAFGGWFDDYYESIYLPAIQSAGLHARRADDLYRPSTIVHDIWAYTKAAKLVLADLTGKNPNVFYELGLAHALAKPVVLVAESINDVPFDLRALRIIEYDKNEPRWGDTLRDKVTQSITEILAAPLASVLPAFIETKHQPETKAISEQEKSLIELRQDMDLLRRELRLRDTELLDGPVRNRISGPEEARALISRYLKMGMPPDQILRRLRASGVPTSWAEEQMAQMGKRPRTARTKGDV